jgi:hypothetical protein
MPMLTAKEYGLILNLRSEDNIIAHVLRKF